jgi:hypothetical protein
MHAVCEQRSYTPVAQRRMRSGKLGFEYMIRYIYSIFIHAVLCVYHAVYDLSVHSYDLSVHSSIHAHLALSVFETQ